MLIVSRFQGQDPGASGLLHQGLTWTIIKFSVKAGFSPGGSPGVGEGLLPRSPTCWLSGSLPCRLLDQEPLDPHWMLAGSHPLFLAMWLLHMVAGFLRVSRQEEPGRRREGGRSHSLWNLIIAVPPTIFAVSVIQQVTRGRDEPRAWGSQGAIWEKPAQWAKQSTRQLRPQVLKNQVGSEILEGFPWCSSHLRLTQPSSP